MALVFSVITDSIPSGFKQKPSSSTSIKIGLAPTIITTEAVAKNVKGVVITSSPGPILFAIITKWPAVVPLLVATAYFTPHISANSSSNLATSGPCAMIPDFRTLSTAARSSDPIKGLAIDIII